MDLPSKNSYTQPANKIRFIYGIIVLVFIIFAIRLFYLQVIRYDYYKTQALNDQLKQYVIPANRGTIAAHDGDSTMPVVLNQKLFLLYADPVFIKKPAELAPTLAPIIGGDATKYEKLMKTKNSRYVILGKKITKQQKIQIDKLKSPGLGTVEQNYRIYPQGTLASQLLGFVDDEGNGKYGIEQYLNKELRGVDGKLKAITDANGVPLAASNSNVKKSPKNGNNLVLTVDLALQQKLESILVDGIKNSKAASGSALILDANTGAVKAMANSPTYDPAKYYEVENGELFSNSAVAHPIEIGSTMKPLTTAAGLDKGSYNAKTTYYDPASWTVNEFKIKNIEEDGGAGTRSIADILNLSLNTGATWELMQMGGGQINSKARETWYDYMTKHFMFGKQTGIEQGYEASGIVPSPKENGAGINLTYANTSFGQAMTATPIQLASATAAMVNGGKYYRPYLVEQKTDTNANKTYTKPQVIKKDVVSPNVSKEMVPLLENVVNNHNFAKKFDQSAFSVGGKTGTAQIAKPGGGYYEDKFNGTYMGFVGNEKPQYVIVVFVFKPTIGGYAGSAAAMPIFGNLAHMLIDESYVSPKQN